MHDSSCENSAGQGPAPYVIAAMWHMKIIF